MIYYLSFQSIQRIVKYLFYNLNMTIKNHLSILQHSVLNLFFKIIYLNCIIIKIIYIKCDFIKYSFDIVKPYYKTLFILIEKKL